MSSLFNPAYESSRVNACENCGIAPLERFEVPQRARLWRCSACGLFQKGDPPPPMAYENQYHAGYLRALPRKVRTAQIRLSRMSTYLDDPAPSVLDVGCSIGATVAAAERRGWPAYGVDISRTAVEICRRQGLNCRHYEGERLPYADESFDVLTAWHVIEHVSDVTRTLQDWYRVLRPGGLLMLETPDAECWKARILKDQYAKFWPAEHLYTFTPRTLTPFLERIGYEPLPTPLVVSPKHVSLITAGYQIAHQSILAAARMTRFSKAFQLIARKPRNLSEVARHVA